ncbi:dihydrolipoamide acetyltransferase family protein [Bacillus horti]|nr:dihydrolipoamide acetyltransferase family protein [Bacillus horti]
MKLHDIGEGMTEGEVVRILVQPGDRIQADQPVLEVQTDKVCAELPAPVGGKVVEILVQVGDVMRVGSTLIKIEEHSQEQAEERAKVQAEVQDEVQVPLETTHLSVKEDNSKHPSQLKNVKAAPYTRKMARDYGINIETLQGTGPYGRITIDDVARYASEHGKSEAFGEVATTTIAHQQKNADTTFEPTISSSMPEVIPFTGRRKQIAHKMSQSMLTIPHVTHFDRIDFTQLQELREQYHKDTQGSSTNLAGEYINQERLSVMAFIIKALAMSLDQFRIFNAKLNEEKGEISIESHVNVGIAVHTDEGLIVPVLHHAENLSIFDINEQMKQLTYRAQHNQLQASDLRGGTITISNVGPIGGMFATPIINYPEVALLAFHQLEDMPVVRNKEIVIRSMMNFSMSFDHRVADGVTAVQFTNQMKRMLENPLSLFSKLI